MALTRKTKLTLPSFQCPAGRTSSHHIQHYYHIYTFCQHIMYTCIFQKKKEYYPTPYSTTKTNIIIIIIYTKTRRMAAPLRTTCICTSININPHRMSNIKQIHPLIKWALDIYLGGKGNNIKAIMQSGSTSNIKSG